MVFLFEDDRDSDSDAILDAGPANIEAEVSRRQSLIDQEESDFQLALRLSQLPSDSPNDVQVSPRFVLQPFIFAWTFYRQNLFDTILVLPHVLWVLY